MRAKILFLLSRRNLHLSNELAKIDFLKENEYHFLKKFNDEMFQF